METTEFEFEKSVDRFEVGHNTSARSSQMTDIQKPASLNLAWSVEENNVRHTTNETECLLFKESKHERVSPQKQKYPCKVISILEDEVECQLELDEQSSSGFIPKAIFFENEIPIKSGQMFNIVFENFYGKRVMQMECVLPETSEKKKRVLDLIDSL